jgi:hypothetical protein
MWSRHLWPLASRSDAAPRFRAASGDEPRDYLLMAQSL